MKKYKNIKPLPLVAAVALALVSCSSLALGSQASAAALTQTSVRLDRLNYSQATAGNVCFKPLLTTAITFLAVTVPTNSATDYSVGAPASLVASGVADASLGGIAVPSFTTVTPTVSVKTITWPVTSFTPTTGQVYCFRFNNGLTTANNNTEITPGSFQTQGAGNTPVENGSFSIGLAAPATGLGDQITITGGVVPPTFKFTLNGGADAFTTNITLGTVASTAAGRTITIITNAANGYVVWARDSNAGTGASAGLGALSSTTAGFKLAGTAAIGTASRLLAINFQDYGLGVTVGGAGFTGSPNAAYNGAGTNVGTLDPVNFQPIAASSTATGNDVLTLVERAASSTTTKAASDYTDLIQLTGAGLF